MAKAAPNRATRRAAAATAGPRRRGFIDVNGDFCEGTMEGFHPAQPGTMAVFRDEAAESGYFLQPVVGYTKIVSASDETGLEIETFLPLIDLEDRGLCPVSIQDDDEGRTDYCGVLMPGEPEDRVLNHMVERFADEEDEPVEVEGEIVE